MVEMAAATAIFFIAAAVLLSLLLGMPWWAQAAGVLFAVAALVRVSRWLVKETLDTEGIGDFRTAPTIEFDYRDAEEKLRHCVVEVSRVSHEFFEGQRIDGAMPEVFFLTRIEGPINDKRSGKSLPAKTWAQRCRPQTLGIATNV